MFSAPSPPPPPPPPPSREDPSIKAAKERQRQAELSRKGRAAAVLFGDKEEAELGAPNVAQPKARAGAKLLGA